MKTKLTPREQEVYDFIVACKQNGDPFSQIRVATAFKFDRITAAKHIKSLISKGWLKAVFREVFADIELV